MYFYLEMNSVYCNLFQMYENTLNHVCIINLLIFISHSYPTRLKCVFHIDKSVFYSSSIDQIWLEHFFNQYYSIKINSVTNSNTSRKFHHLKRTLKKLCRTWESDSVRSCLSGTRQTRNRTTNSLNIISEISRSWYQC